MSTPKPSACEAGVALVTTVIILAVMAIVAVALMQGVTADRYSSRSVANYTRAKLAADAGLAVASAALATNSANDTFIVVLNTDRQLFVGNGVTNPATSTNFGYVPMFSTFSNLSTPIAAVTSGVVPITNVSGGVVFTNQLPGGLSITSPAVSWVYLGAQPGPTNTNNPAVARFAYWVEDLGGKLDLSVVGVTNALDITNARRMTGTNPAEIALWSFFNPSSASDAGNAVAGSLVAARSALLTPATALLVNSGVTSGLLADLTVNLPYDTNEPEMVPFGFGYADQGKPKYNLNTNISAAGVSAIANIINANLPQFGARGGAMSPAAYVTNIAAGIVDYADTNQQVTADSANPPLWRGVEAIAWPNEIFTRLSLDPVDGRTFAAPDVTFKVTLQQFVEVWNLSSKEVTAGTNCSISNNLDIPLRISPNWVGNLRNVDATQAPRIETFINSMALPPNSYGILATAPRVFQFSVSTNLTGGLTNPPLLMNDTTFSAVARRANAVTFFVDGKPVSATPGGRAVPGPTSLQLVPAVTSAVTFVTPIAMGTDDPTRTSADRPAPYNLAGGDPRAQLFMSNLPAMGVTYTNDGSRGGSTPGGRNRLSAAQGAVRTVEPELNWPDGGHSLGQAGVDVGTTPATSVAPAAGAGRTGDTNHYLQKISDAGRITNIAELGRVYDSLQWKDEANPFHPLDSAAWMNLSMNATPFSGAGGRNSLRIGRPEHVKLATDGQRATQLLDIFAANTNALGPGGVVRSGIAGKININTAGTNALRALAAGVANSTDSALLPGGTNFTVPVSAVNAFIAGVTNFRTQRPFSSPAQLTQIATNTNTLQWPTNAVFGNFGPTLDSTTYPVGAIRPYSAGNPAIARVTEWSDEAAEEWFARVYPLATVRSRNFLVHVVGQALMTNGTTVLSTAKRAFQIYMEPQRSGTTGLSTNSVPRVLATWDL